MKAYTFLLFRDPNSSWIQAKNKKTTFPFMLLCEIVIALITMTHMLNLQLQMLIFYFLKKLPIALSILILFACILSYTTTDFLRLE